MSIESDRAIEWIETLASNDYRRGTSKLKQGGGYCCLGVAQDMFNLEGNELKEYLTPEAAETLGLKGPGAQMAIADINDMGPPKAGFEDVVKELLSNTEFYFKEGVAQDIQEHFWGNK